MSNRNSEEMVTVVSIHAKAAEGEPVAFYRDGVAYGFGLDVIKCGDSIMVHNPNDPALGSKRTINGDERFLSDAPEFRSSPCGQEF